MRYWHAAGVRRSAVAGFGYRSRPHNPGGCARARSSFHQCQRRDDTECLLVLRRPDPRACGAAHGGEANPPVTDRQPAKGTGGNHFAGRPGVAFQQRAARGRGSGVRERTGLREKKESMPNIDRTARAEWNGDLRSGQGTTSTGSGVLRDVTYSVPSRFQDGQGTNPEELIAAAHASCFSMMLSKILTDQKRAPKRISTEAKLTLRQADGGAKITGIHLKTEASVDGM